MKYLWWIYRGAGADIGLFFLFGLDLLIGSYRLNDPFSFIMTFFAASFVLLISAALAVTFAVKMIRVYRRIRNQS